MRKIAVLGIGQTKIDEHWEKSLREIAGDAAFAAMQDAGVEKVDALFVGNMLSPLINGQNQLGAYLADWIGLWKQEAVKIEAACGSGAAAFRAALMAVASGDIESALVVGVEKMTDKAGRDVTAALATAADADYEVEQGISFVGINALVMRRYMHEFGWKHEDFAQFSINAHANAMHNPYARLHEKISVEKFEKSSMVATPINLLDASPIGDGAAAMVIVPAENRALLSQLRLWRRIRSQSTHAKTPCFCRLRMLHQNMLMKWLVSLRKILMCLNFMMHSQSWQRFRWKPADLQKGVRG